MKLKFIGDSPQDEAPENERFIIEVSDIEWMACRVYPYKTCMTATLVDTKESKGCGAVGSVSGNFLNPFAAMDSNCWPVFVATYKEI